jgi:hypothetical protein
LWVRGGGRHHALKLACPDGLGQTPARLGVGAGSQGRGMDIHGVEAAISLTAQLAPT